MSETLPMFDYMREYLNDAIDVLGDGSRILPGAWDTTTQQKIGSLMLPKLYGEQSGNSVSEKFTKNVEAFAANLTNYDGSYHGSIKTQLVECLNKYIDEQKNICLKQATADATANPGIVPTIFSTNLQNALKTMFTVSTNAFTHTLHIKGSNIKTQSETCIDKHITVANNAEDKQLTAGLTKVKSLLTFSNGDFTDTNYTVQITSKHEALVNTIFEDASKVIHAKLTDKLSSYRSNIMGGDPVKKVFEILKRGNSSDINLFSEFCDVVEIEDTRNIVPKASYSSLDVTKHRINLKKATNLGKLLVSLYFSDEVMKKFEKIYGECVKGAQDAETKRAEYMAKGTNGRQSTPLNPSRQVAYVDRIVKDLQTTKPVAEQLVRQGWTINPDGCYSLITTGGTITCDPQDMAKNCNGTYLDESRGQCGFLMGDKPTSVGEYVRYLEALKEAMGTKQVDEDMMVKTSPLSARTILRNLGYPRDERTSKFMPYREWINSMTHPLNPRNLPDRDAIFKLLSTPEYNEVKKYIELLVEIVGRNKDFLYNVEHQNDPKPVLQAETKTKTMHEKVKEAFEKIPIGEVSSKTRFGDPDWVGVISKIEKIVSEKNYHHIARQAYDPREMYVDARVLVAELPQTGGAPGVMFQQAPLVMLPIAVTAEQQNPRLTNTYLRKIEALRAGPLKQILSEEEIETLKRKIASASKEQQELYDMINDMLNKKKSVQSGNVVENEAFFNKLVETITEKSGRVDRKNATLNTILNMLASCDTGNETTHYITNYP